MVPHLVLGFPISLLGQILLDLSSEDLKDIGVSLGNKKVLLKALEVVKAQEAAKVKLHLIFLLIPILLAT